MRRRNIGKEKGTSAPELWDRFNRQKSTCEQRNVSPGLKNSAFCKEEGTWRTKSCMDLVLDK